VNEHTEGMTPEQAKAWYRIDVAIRVNIGRSLPDMTADDAHRLARLAVFAYESREGED
jgi:hypothetical protein